VLDPRELWSLSPWLLAFAVAAIVIVLQAWRLARLRRAARTGVAAAAREDQRREAMLARRLRAADGEESAFGLLERAGYLVLGRQVAGSWTVRADGEPLTFGLRADYLVQRAGRRYVAEVKTGRLAPRLSHGPTRRQLLEYSSAFDVHGVILVDADAETLTHVEVERGARPRGAVAIVAVLCFAAGLGVGAALVR
jgi:hypothetical protein